MLSRPKTRVIQAAVYGEEANDVIRFVALLNLQPPRWSRDREEDIDIVASKHRCVPFFRSLWTD